MDSGATITSTRAVTKAIPLSLRRRAGKEVGCYIAESFDGRDALLAKLGEHKTGKVCVYIRRLANVDLKVLETLVALSVAETTRRYPQPNENNA